MKFRQFRPSVPTSLRARLAGSFALLGLAFALFLGVIAYRAAEVGGLGPDAAQHFRTQILWWGTGAVILSLILGIFLTRMISAPISRLSAELRRQDFLRFPWRSSQYKNYAELEQLVCTIQELADTIRSREQDLLHTQETLRALNESLKAIVETSPLAIYSITPRGIVTLWNPAAERLFGRKESEVLGEPSPLVVPGREDSASSIRERVLAGETIHNLEIGRHRPDGTLIEISLSAAPLLGGGR